MARIVTDRSDSMYVEPHRGVRGGTSGEGSSLTTGQVAGLGSMRECTFRVDQISNADSVETQFQDIFAVAFQADDITHQVAAEPENAGTGRVRFGCPAGTYSGYLWVKGAS